MFKTGSPGLFGGKLLLQNICLRDAALGFRKLIGQGRCLLLFVLQLSASVVSAGQLRSSVCEVMFKAGSPGLLGGKLLLQCIRLRDAALRFRKLIGQGRCPLLRVLQLSAHVRRGGCLRASVRKVAIEVGGPGLLSRQLVAQSRGPLLFVLQLPAGIVCTGQLRTSVCEVVIEVGRPGLLGRKLIGEVCRPLLFVLQLAAHVCRGGGLRASVCEIAIEVGSPGPLGRELIGEVCRPLLFVLQLAAHICRGGGLRSSVREIAIEVGGPCLLGRKLLLQRIRLRGPALGLCKLIGQSHGPILLSLQLPASIVCAGQLRASVREVMIEGGCPCLFGRKLLLQRIRQRGPALGLCKLIGQSRGPILLGLQLPASVVGDGQLRASVCEIMIEGGSPGLLGRKLLQYVRLRGPAIALRKLINGDRAPVLLDWHLDAGVRGHPVGVPFHKNSDRDGQAPGEERDHQRNGDNKEPVVVSEPDRHRTLHLLARIARQDEYITSSSNTLEREPLPGACRRAQHYLSVIVC